MANFGYHMARAKGRAVRRLYRGCLNRLPAIESRCSFPLEVLSYSGQAALPEQVASIRSFLRHVGRPLRFTVVSDGTYSEQSVRLLTSLDASVSVNHIRDWIPKGLPADIYPFLTTHPMGGQVALFMSLPRGAPVLYLDSDVLFFAGANDLHSCTTAHDVPALYLLDCRFSGDERLLRTSAEQEDPVNAGFLLFFRKLDWSGAIRRFLELEGEPNFFTNQTMTHLAMHANGAAPFDPRKYVLQLDAQLIYPDRYANPGIALRHYVNPVRHKFWTSLFV